MQAVPQCSILLNRKVPYCGTAGFPNKPKTVYYCALPQEYTVRFLHGIAVYLAVTLRLLRERTEIDSKKTRATNK